MISGWVELVSQKYSTASPEIQGPDVCVITPLTDYQTSLTESSSGFLM